MGSMGGMRKRGRKEKTEMLNAKDSVIIYRNLIRTSKYLSEELVNNVYRADCLRMRSCN
jgi:hypothetical protein